MFWTETEPLLSLQLCSQASNQNRNASGNLIGFKFKFQINVLIVYNIIYLTHNVVDQLDIGKAPYTEGVPMIQQDLSGRITNV